MNSDALPNPQDVPTPEPPQTEGRMALPELKSVRSEARESQPETGEAAAIDASPLPLAQPTPPASESPSLDLSNLVAPIESSSQAALQAEITALKATRDQLKTEISQTQSSLGRLIQNNLQDLEQRKQTLQLAIEQLERRQERIRKEMRTTFAGSSQEIAIRVQSFKDYLVGSLQDLAIAAEQLELPSFAPEVTAKAPAPIVASDTPEIPSFRAPAFQDTSAKVRGIIEQFRQEPDYYGPVWKLRRTFEVIHGERVSQWFFEQGGRGAVRTLGSRLQNILVASAVISILYSLNDSKSANSSHRLRTLILANSPERLGEWRRGLQDCLGVSRSDFGADRGISLFETPEQLALRAERLEKEGHLPLIIMDETEEMVSLALLQFPLWLAFAPNPQQLIQSPSYF